MDFGARRQSGGLKLVQNVYGLSIGDLQGAGLTRYGLYQTGYGDTNYFAGNTAFGTTSTNTVARLDWVEPREDVFGAFLLGGVSARQFEAQWAAIRN